ncbi:unnamed protein product [Lactuca saligna]|uniref:Uncharacterized protein n=1 Tax=Lactuca saligna TaxID=75948 RepID=A0AA35ZZ12_LACSI|nr:unnamed protein product [Lactuca saligna]
MFNTSATLLQSKKHNPKHPTSIVVVAAALIPFRIVAIDDEKETTMRLAGEQPCHLLRLFITSSPFCTFPYRTLATFDLIFPSSVRLSTYDTPFDRRLQLPSSHVCFDAGSGKGTTKEGSPEIHATPPHDHQPPLETPIVRLTRFFPYSI